MRAKLLIILLGLLGLFSAAIVFRVDQLLFADKLNSSEAQARAQVGAVAETIASDLKSARETMELAWPQIHADKKDYAKGRPYSRFAMLATLSRANSGEWNIDAKYFLENSPAKAWAANYVTLALKGVQEKKVPVGGTAVLSMLDPARKVFFLVVTHTTSQWLAALSGPELFQGAMDRQKGLASTFFIVNPIGQTLGHTVHEYVGSLLHDDPIVADLIKNESGSGFGVFQAASGPVQGFYEQVPQSNVFVVVSTPVNELMAGRKDVRWQLVLMGLGFALVGTALVMSLVKERPVDAPIFTTHVTPPHATIVTPPEAGGERLKAYTHAASSLAHELRGPLLSMLGRARLLRESVPDEKFQKELMKLEEGAREAHGTLHKLLTFSGEKEEPTVPTSLAEVINRTLRMMEAKIRNSGVAVETLLAEVPLIQGQPSLLVKAFEQIFDNSIEAMHKGFSKKMKIELKPRDGNVFLSIHDSGEGIEPANLNQIFDPFFTTKSSGSHSGLGLSLALGIIRACGGHMNVKSTPSQGTDFEIVFTVDQPEVEVEVQYQRHEKHAPPAPIAAIEAEMQHQGQFDHQEPAGVDERTVIISESDDFASFSLSHADPSTVAPSLAAPKLELPEVLNDQLMEKTLDMIDQLDDEPDAFSTQVPRPSSEPPPFRKPAPRVPVPLVEGAAGPPQAPPEPPPPPGSGTGTAKFTAKIDKPKMTPKKKDSRLLETGAEVRRPGDRS